MWVPTMRSVQLRNGLRVCCCVTGGGEADFVFGDGKCALASLISILAWITVIPIDVRSEMSVIQTRESYEVKPSSSSFGVRVSAWPEIQAGKPWSQPWIQAAVSGSAIFLAGEAGMGCAEGVALVSTTMFSFEGVVEI